MWCFYCVCFIIIPFIHDFIKPFCAECIVESINSFHNTVIVNFLYLLSNSLIGAKLFPDLWDCFIISSGLRRYCFVYLVFPLTLTPAAYLNHRHMKIGMPKCLQHWFMLLFFTRLFLLLIVVYGNIIRRNIVDIVI